MRPRDVDREISNIFCEWCAAETGEDYTRWLGRTLAEARLGKKENLRAGTGDT